MATNVLMAAKQAVNLLLTIVGVLMLVIGVVIYLRFAMGLGLGIMGNGVSVSHGTRLKIT